MKSFILFFVFLSVSFAYSQSLVVRFVAKDKQSGDFVSRVCIQELERGVLLQTTYTNILGEAFFQVHDRENVHFTYNHSAYFVLDEFNPKQLKSIKTDTITIVLRLYFNQERLLDEVTVKPVGRPDTVFESERVSVSDFEFMPSGNLLLLTYPKTLSKGTELVLFDGQKILSYIPLTENGKELIRDYLKNAHVVCENTVFGIHEMNNQIEVSPIPKEYFNAYIKPIVDSNQSKLYFTNFNPNYPAFDYYSFETKDSVYQHLCEVKDNLMMELYRSEFKYVDVRIKIWAKEKEKETGIDKEIWVGMNYFTNSIYYKELYAPLFQLRDTFYLFDHYQNQLFSFDKNGSKIDSLPIYYHLQPNVNGWKKQIIQDFETGELFLCFEQGGKMKLRHFDVSTGKLSAAIELHFKYPQEVQIRNNIAYYIYRPYESIQKKYLYSERLPFEFKK